jgi:hypothetical protein
MCREKEKEHLFGKKERNKREITFLREKER